MSGFESPSHFFAEINHRLFESRGQDTPALHLIIADIASGFSREQEIKALVVRGVLRPGSADADAQLVKDYLQFRTGLRQAFEADSEVRFAFLAHFADIVAAQHEG
ncbi:MAG: hypothetical protein EBV03_08475 [Proteobacteria bacterium]|nr:hypothetical protein [Pseudomonadota bacterium]